MKIKYLGTGSAEGFPAVFCSCDACQKAVKLGGKNIRHRTCSIIDGKILVDFPPDVQSQAMHNNVDLSKVNNLLLSHSHADHFFPLELRKLAPPYCLSKREQKFNIYGSNFVGKALEDQLLSRPQGRVLRELLSFTPLEPFNPTPVGEHTVTAMASRHSEGSFVYLIEKGGTTTLYGNDTGFFPEETWDYLQGKKLNLVTLDCKDLTQADTENHMTFEDNLTVKKRLYQQDNLYPNTKFVATHFSHESAMLHQDISERLRLYGIIVSYDGLEIEF